MKEPIPAPTIPVYTSNQPQYQPVRGMPGYPASPYQSQVSFCFDNDIVYYVSACSYMLKG